MSLATSIKDFSDTLNNLHTVESSSLPILPFLQEIFVFTVKTIISGAAYIFTFGWFQDVSYLPLINPASPQQLEIANAERLLFPGFTFSNFGDSFFTDPISSTASCKTLFCTCAHFLSFSSAVPLYDHFPKNSTNYIFSGVVNSFFFSLPFSLSHLISIRRLFSQGIHAAVASLFGSIAAHSLFLISIFYGLRFFIIPWFSLEPLTYILGFSLNVLVIKELIQASPQRFQKSSYAGMNTKMDTTTNRLESFKNQFFGLSASSQQFKETSKNKVILSPTLLRISVLSFGLTWCEELNVFSSITGLTLNAQNAYLDLYPSTNASNSLVVHTIYLLAFILGNCAFSFLFYYLLFKSGPIIASWTNLSSTKVNNAISKLVMLLILTFTFASFPYYGLDYLFGKTGGFLPEDPVYKETVLSPTKITVNKKNTLFIKAESADKKKHTSLLDINNFDNGVYLNNIDFNKFDNFPSDSKGSITRTTSFEKSNYRQENAWIRRNYLARLRARPRKNTDNNSTASFYKAFKDPKAYYQKIQLESDRKQNKKIRDTRAKKPYGYFVGRHEGVLAEEPISKIQNFWDRILGFSGKYKSGAFAKGSEAYLDNVLQIVKKTDYLDITKTETPVDTTPSSLFNLDNFRINKNNVGTGVSVGNKTFSNDRQKDNELDSETNIFAEKYTKGVKQKSSAPLLKKTKSLSTKNIIKRKFFLNPVYRTLLQTDIDAFMARQPVVHNIAENQDYELYKKRVILEKYYNWLRYYSPLQKNLKDLYNISETKSFVDSVFHHQFKGTLKIAKRLFPVTFDPQQNGKKHRVLSYDQTLYKNLQTSENPFLHEELVLPNNQTRTRSKLKSEDNTKQSLVPRVSKDVLAEKSFNNSREALQVPFIEESDTSPFYAGWDDTLRRFVITNKFFVDKE